MRPLTELTQLKYQVKPQLIIEECLQCDNPIEEIKDCLMALAVFGLKDLATTVEKSLNQYGIELDYIVHETYV